MFIYACNAVSIDTIVNCFSKAAIAEEDYPSKDLEDEIDAL